MDLLENREWMYKMRLTSDGRFNPEFELYVHYFLEFAYTNATNRLCDYWDTPEWKNISICGKRNRCGTDGSAVTARHTGGSIGISETRKRMRKLMGKEPDWDDVFMQTRLKADSKTKYFNGEFEGLQFVTPTAKEAHEVYKRGIAEKYGDDPTQQRHADPEVWSTTQLQRQGGKGKGRIYGIGSSDLHFAVTGTYSSGSTSSSIEQSQAEVLRLKEQMANMQIKVLQDQKKMEEEMQAKFDLQLKKSEEEMDARLQIRQHEYDVRQSQVDEKIATLTKLLSVNQAKQH